MPVFVECSACHARLALADDLYDRKVRGRVVTIGCKRCGGNITVDGTKAHEQGPPEPSIAPATPETHADAPRPPANGAASTQVTPSDDRAAPLAGTAHANEARSGFGSAASAPLAQTAPTTTTAQAASPPTTTTGASTAAQTSPGTEGSAASKAVTRLDVKRPAAARPKLDTGPKLGTAPRPKLESAAKLGSGEPTPAPRPKLESAAKLGSGEPTPAPRPRAGVKGASEATPLPKAAGPAKLGTGEKTPAPRAVTPKAPATVAAAVAAEKGVPDRALEKSALNKPAAEPAPADKPKPAKTFIGIGPPSTPPVAAAAPEAPARKSTPGVSSAAEDDAPPSSAELDASWAKEFVDDEPAGSRNAGSVLVVPPAPLMRDSGMNDEVTVRAMVSDFDQTIRVKPGDELPVDGEETVRWQKGAPEYAELERALAEARGELDQLKRPRKTDDEDGGDIVTSAPPLKLAENKAFRAAAGAPVPAAGSPAGAQPPQATAASSVAQNAAPAQSAAAVPKAASASASTAANAVAPAQAAAPAHAVVTPPVDLTTESPRRLKPAILLLVLAIVVTLAAMIWALASTPESPTPALDPAATAPAEKVASKQTADSTSTSAAVAQPAAPAEPATRTPEADLPATQPTANEPFANADESDSKSAKTSKLRYRGVAPKREEPAPAPAPPPPPTPRAIDANAAKAAVSKAAASVSYCPKRGGDPSGTANATVTFGPSGRVTSAKVGAPFAGRPIGACIENRLRQATVPAFDGSPRTLTVRVRVP